MPQPRGRAADRTETRQRIIDAAFDVFAERGFHAAALEEIVSRAGYTRGAFHSNFESKEELFLAVIDRQIDIEARVIAERLAAGMPLTDAVKGDDPLPSTKRRQLRLVNFEFWLYAARHPKWAARLKKMTSRRVGQLADTISAEAKTRGLELSVSPEVAARLILAVNTHNGLQHAVMGVDTSRDLSTPLFALLGLEPTAQSSETPTH